MTSARRERSARTKFYAVAAAAALASLALFAAVGLTRREADRREPAKPQGVPPSRPTAGIVGGGDALLLRRRRDAAADDARVLTGNTRRPPRAARGLGDGRADGRVRRSARTAPRAGGGGVRVGGPPPLAPEPKPPLVRHVFPR